MKQSRLIGVALLAVFALGAIAASAAQAEEAPYWTVNGTRLEAGQTRFITTKESKPFVLGGDGLTITCTETNVLPHGVLLGSNAGEPGTDDETASFKVCKAEGNSVSKCGALFEPINTTNLKSELVLDKTKTKLLTLFQPRSGSLLATIKFEACEFKVTGSFLVEALNSKEEAITTSTPKEQAASGYLRFPAAQPVEVWLIKAGTGSLITAKPLEIAGAPLTLSGQILILLAELNSKDELVSTGEEWSALA
jgi:hypothetical protein